MNRRTLRISDRFIGTDIESIYLFYLRLSLTSSEILVPATIYIEYLPRWIEIDLKFILNPLTPYWESKVKSFVMIPSIIIIVCSKTSSK